jgi:hypothetical protein
MATTTFNDLITFSRGSNATVTGPNGLIQWAPANLLTNSQDFDSANWLKLAAGTGVAPTVTANAGVAPDGTTTADRAQLNRGAGTTASDVSRLFQNVALLPTDVGMLSVWLRSFDGVSTYTVGLTNGSASSTVTVTGVWQRFSLASISSTANAQVRLQGDITQQTADLLVWGAQLELGSTATTYNNTSVRNLQGFSEAFDNAAWTKGGTSIVTGAQANPVNGLFNAQKLMEDASTGLHRTLITGSVVSGTPYVFSVYVKAAGRTLVNLNVATGVIMNVTFDVAAGVVTNTTSGVGSITSVGGGWYRLAVSATAATTTTPAISILLVSTGTTVNYTGDGNSGVYIYGAMLSNSASLDPYVPTPGAAPSSTAYYGPRFDYDPVTLLPRGLLIEEQRTNGNLYSEDLSNAYWTVSGASLSGGNAAPSGSLVAYKLVENTANSTHQIGRATAVSATNATVHTMSFYVKAAGRSRLRLYIFGFNNYTPIIDLTSRTVVSAAGGTAPVVTFTNVADGYIRIAITDTTTASELQFDGIYLVNTGTTFSYTGDGVSGVILWGFQREVGAFATSYIPTIASTVTRSADAAAITGSLFSQWYNQSEGGFIIDYGALASFNFPTPFMAADSAASSTKRIQIYLSGNSPTYRVTDGTDQAAVSLPSVTIPATSKYAVTYRLNDFAGTANGGSVGTDTSGTIPAVNTLYIGNQNSAQFINGHIRSIRYVPVRAADFQLQQVTT